MGYGTISVIPSDAQSSEITTRNIQNESSPLITRQRRTTIQSLGREAVFNWRTFLLFSILLSGIFIGCHLLALEYNDWPENYPFHLINRDYWYRGEPINIANLTLLNSSQVFNVVLFHTRGEFCHDFSSCLIVIRELHEKDFTNLPFNFLIGGDGKTYELRGWNYESGFNSLPFNDKAIAVALVGDFTFVEPSSVQIQELEALISESIRRQKLQKKFKIHGARLHFGHKMFKQLKMLPEFVGWI